MNTNEYIEKFSQVDVNKADGLVTVEVTVPPRKVVTYKHEECDESQHMKIFDRDIREYLESKNINILSAVCCGSIDNKHPRGLSGTWQYKIEPTSVKKKKNRKKGRGTSIEESSSMTEDSLERTLKNL